MALTDEDIDRIGDKMELKLNAAFERHIEKNHIVLDGRLTSLERSKWYERGIFAAIIGAVELARH